MYKLTLEMHSRVGIALTTRDLITDSTSLSIALIIIEEKNYAHPGATSTMA